ncbi:MAG: excinuclease ABC subunit UvrC [Chitinispirillaceae bacterium]
MKSLDKIIETVNRFPRCPGVYLMKDAENTILYIGKAIDLRSRVRSYFFDSHDDRIQIPVMLSKLDHIDWIATGNETEALILEANLIRTHKPRYNVDLKDDKHYPYLKVTVNEPFPRLFVTRRVYKDGARYFGPYTDVRAMRKLMALAKRVFKIRECRKHLPLAKPIRPCINYSIGRCSGPCGQKISSEEYQQNIATLLDFLRGKRKEVIDTLERRMLQASTELAFEKAAHIRDQISLLKQSPDLQRVDLRAPDINTDIFGFAEADRYLCLSVLSFRQGLLMHKRHFLFKRQAWEMSKENPEMLIIQYYEKSIDEPPGEILLPQSISWNTALLGSWFETAIHHSVQISIPQRGNKVQLIAMAEKNARLYGAQKISPDAEADLQDLQDALKLPRLPATIEAFDISNLGQSFAVAGMVHFSGGRPDKSQYRRFKIKTVSGQNDFAMMMEAVTRRLTRLHSEGKDFPDLLLIDGGKGQLSAAMEPLRQFDQPPMIASLAKKEELLFSPYSPEPVRLPQSHPARRLVERIRDEVHRWSITYHRSLRGKQFKKSSLENLEGIGRKKADLLLKHFGSYSRLKQASVEEIARVKGFSASAAEKLKKQLDSPPAEGR